MQSQIVSRSSRSAVAEADIFAGLVDTLYAGIGTQGWQPFVDLLSQAYQGALVTLGLRDYTVQRTWASSTSSWDDGHIARYDAYYSGVDEWAPHSARYPVGQVAVSDDLVLPGPFMDSEFYQDWCRPAGIDVGICALLQREGTRAMGVAVLLPRRAHEADLQSVARLRRLVPHMLRAAQLERQLQGQEVRAQSAEAALANLGVATLLCDATARPLQQNQAAETLLSAGDGVILSHGRLDTLVPAEGRMLRDLIANAAEPRSIAEPGAGGVMPVSRRNGKAAYEILVTTAPVFGTGGPSGRSAAVFVRDPLLRRVPKPEHLRQLYGLSVAEARLLRTLLSGASLEEAAVQHRLSRETLRTQLRGLFRKLEVGSQRELVLRCNGSLAGLHPG